MKLILAGVCFGYLLGTQSVVNVPVYYFLTAIGCTLLAIGESRRPVSGPWLL